MLGRLLAHAVGTDAKTAVNGLLRRLEEVADRPCNAADVERLPFDRLTRPWQPTFERAAWLLRGLYPDVRAGKMAGVCLLFSMERLFEAFMGVVLRRQWRSSDATVVLQGPSLHFARASGGLAFGLRPDATVIGADKQPVLIADAKWKRLDVQAANSGVGRDDIYQMAAYAGRYECRDLALLYPSGDGVPPGQLQSFTLQDAFGAVVNVYAIDIAALTRGAALPARLCPPETLSLPQCQSPSRHGVAPRQRSSQDEPIMRQWRPTSPTRRGERSHPSGKEHEV